MGPFLTYCKDPVNKGFHFRCTLVVSLHCHMCTSVRLCGTLCGQIFCIFRFFVKILLLLVTVSISLDSLTNVHCQFMSNSVLPHTLWTSTAAVSSQQGHSLCPPPSLSPQNTHTHLATVHYHRICSL